MLLLKDKNQKTSKQTNKQNPGVGGWLGLCVIYLFQQCDRISAVLQAGGEAGGGRGVVILCGLGDELRHGDLVRHDPTTPVKPTVSRAHRSGGRGSQVWGGGGRWRGKKEGEKKKIAEGRR